MVWGKFGRYVCDLYVMNEPDVINVFVLLDTDLRWSCRSRVWPWSCLWKLVKIDFFFFLSVEVIFSSVIVQEISVIFMLSPYPPRSDCCMWSDRQTFTPVHPHRFTSLPACPLHPLTWYLRVHLTRLTFFSLQAYAYNIQSLSLYKCPLYIFYS